MSERRPPFQGGLAPAEGLAGNVVEVACDESGFSGSNLLDVATPVFTHASVDLSLDEAVQVMTQLRSRLPRAPGEVKAGQLLGHRQADESVESLLAALSGRAYVVVVDKEHFLATRVVDLFLAEPTYAAGTRLSAELRPAALSLYRAGRSGGTAWNGFLAAFVDLVQTKRRRQSEGDVVARFFAAHGELAASGIGDEAAAVLARLDRTHVTEVVTRLADDDRSIPPPLEPLLPALAETVLFWSGGQRPVLVIHDEQSALTAGRLRRLQQVLPRAADPVDDARSPVAPGPLPPLLAGLVMVDSRDDPRIQLADLLAGVTRRFASYQPEWLEKAAVDSTYGWCVGNL